ncbi:hypothetical protein SHKM778_67900 [Streptomyces sp. KM77-8]|uniref:Uncharacterized protein n=1 Tax=Streptomyces haneummycinicus TaxID=3074435 RepID=A0AAT9HSJ0_9ACTN
MPRAGAGCFGVWGVVDFAAFRAEFGDALLEEVEELGYRDRAGGELEEGEDLRHGRDDLGDGRRLVLLGFRVGQRPGVAEGDPAAQHGAVVAVPGAQPPAGAGAVAVHLDETGQAGGVPVGADLSGGQPQGECRPFGGRVGEGGLAVGGGAVPAGAEGGVGPAGDAGRVRQSGARHSGQLRRCRRALRRSWRGAA